jgi:hypothetical protein
MSQPANNGRDNLVATLERLAEEAGSGRGSKWENVTLASYLEAMAAWLRVYEQAYVNTGRPIPEDVWEVLADAAHAATIYE